MIRPRLPRPAGILQREVEYKRARCSNVAAASELSPSNVRTSSRHAHPTRLLELDKRPASTRLTSLHAQQQRGDESPQWFFFETADMYTMAVADDQSPLLTLSCPFKPVDSRRCIALRFRPSHSHSKAQLPWRLGRSQLPVGPNKGGQCFLGGQSPCLGDLSNRTAFLISCSDADTRPCMHELVCQLPCHLCNARRNLHARPWPGISV